jgi:hypothetical protein
MDECYVVVVRHNLVSDLRREPSPDGQLIPKTKLEIGTQLAENYRSRGSIDGEYRFENAQRAKIFATLCLEFTQALVARRLDALQHLAAGAEYHAEESTQGGDSASRPDALSRE